MKMSFAVSTLFLLLSSYANAADVAPGCPDLSGTFVFGDIPTPMSYIQTGCSKMNVGDKSDPANMEEWILDGQYRDFPGDPEHPGRFDIKYYFSGDSLIMEMYDNGVPDQKIGAHLAATLKTHLDAAKNMVNDVQYFDLEGKPSNTATKVGVRQAP